ncbi:MAG: DUF1330 domain-containing protein, partial [Acidimicrobiales bacterium]
EVLEGEWHGTRTVIVEYPSVEQARKWYESDGYQAALPLRRAASNGNVVIATGFVLGDAGGPEHRQATISRGYRPAGRAVLRPAPGRC